MEIAQLPFHHRQQQQPKDFDEPERSGRGDFHVFHLGSMARRLVHIVHCEMGMTHSQ